MRIAQLGLLLLTLAGAGCTVADAESDGIGTVAETFTVYPSPSVSQEFHILPSSTTLPPHASPGATNGDWDPDRLHYVYRPPIGITTSPPPWRLVLFLPGCNGQPKGYQPFMNVALGQGYHVIGLDYPDPCLGDACGFDSSCMGSYRHEVLFGDSASSLGSSTVAPVDLESHPQDAIIQRLEALLLRLESMDPYGAWSTFMDTDPTAPDGVRLRWDRIVTAGHSLGGGYAAFIATQFTVQRVAMFTAPGDAIDSCTGSGDPLCEDSTTTSDDWLNVHLTSASVQFGLIHALDLHKNNHVHRTVANWQSIGMTPGQYVVSNAACMAVPDVHSCVIADPAFTPRWKVMLGTP